MVPEPFGATMLDAALAWYRAGMSVIPVLPTRRKKPAVKWETYMHQRADEDQIRRWWSTNPEYGIAVICGKVSGNLEMLELEDRVRTDEDMARLHAALDEQSHDDMDLLALWMFLQGGFSEDSPSGGMHVLYRLEDEPVPGNTKIARRPATELELEKNPGDRTKVLAETRGEGGYVIVAPTKGSCHPLGHPWDWRLICGSPQDIPTITWAERQALHAAFRAALDDLEPAQAVRPVESSHDLPPRTDGRLRPGDDFNLRASWADILEPQGWTVSHTLGSVTYWTRPGKKRRDGASATTGRREGDQDCLYVFSSAVDLPQETPLTKLFVYAHYNHRGDLVEAVRELSTSGFGDPVDHDDAWMMQYPVEFRPEPTTYKDSVTPPGVTVNSSTVTTAAIPQQQRRVIFTPASAYPIKRVRWFWEDRAPLGEITMIAGREGVGKSVLLARLAADLTRGHLAGEFFGQPKTVLYATAEDSWNHTVAPRLLAAGADMDMVFHVEVNTDLGKGVISLPNDCREVAEGARDLNAGVLMLDPAISMVSGKIDVNQAVELRRALEPLRRAADEAEIAILALAHFNKNSNVDTSSKVAGSRAWMEVARAAWAVARLPLDDSEEDDGGDSLLTMLPNKVVLSQIKSNLGRLDLPHLTYEIISGTVPDALGVPVSTGRIEWRENSMVSAPDILEAPPASRKPSILGEIVQHVKKTWRDTGMITCYQELYQKFPEVPEGTVRRNVREAIQQGVLHSRKPGEFQPAGTQEN